MYVGTPQRSLFRRWNTKNTDSYHSVDIDFIDPLQKLDFAPFIEPECRFRCTFEDFLASFRPDFIKSNKALESYKVLKVEKMKVRVGIRYKTTISNRYFHKLITYQLMPVTPHHMTHWILETPKGNLMIEDLLISKNS